MRPINPQYWLSHKIRIIQPFVLQLSFVIVFRCFVSVPYSDEPHNRKDYETNKNEKQDDAERVQHHETNPLQ